MKLFKAAVKYGKQGAISTYNTLGKGGRVAALTCALALTVSMNVQALPVVVPYAEIEIDWSALVTAVLATITAVIVIGLSFAFPIWGFRKAYKMFKSTAR